ncbi:hypothetical protein [Dakarella massiliensis]|uniref:hypothetical protein n=1 Tax=Dakarella massiliensis TaxID=1506471 RepID=UPI0011DE1157|nr:hypothetical protein [Dakarella massiliensis]
MEVTKDPDARRSQPSVFSITSACSSSGPDAIRRASSSGTACRSSLRLESRTAPGDPKSPSSRTASSSPISGTVEKVIQA